MRVILAQNITHMLCDVVNTASYFAVKEREREIVGRGPLYFLRRRSRLSFYSVLSDLVWLWFFLFIF